MSERKILRHKKWGFPFENTTFERPPRSWSKSNLRPPLNSYGKILQLLYSIISPKMRSCWVIWPFGLGFQIVYLLLKSTSIMFYVHKLLYHCQNSNLFLNHKVESQIFHQCWAITSITDYECIKGRRNLWPSWQLVVGKQWPL